MSGMLDFWFQLACFSSERHSSKLFCYSFLLSSLNDELCSSCDHLVDHVYFALVLCVV